MSQTRYKRPFNFWAWLTVFLATFAAHFYLLFTNASKWPQYLTVVLMFLVLMIELIFNPGGVRYKKHLADGTPVKIKRPFIGFEQLGTEFGLTGGYEVSVDGWRYEAALRTISFRPFRMVWCGEPVAVTRGDFCAEFDEDLL